MNDIDPAAVMADHDGHGADHLGLCSYQASPLRGRCTTYRLAEALAAEIEHKGEWKAELRLELDQVRAVCNEQAEALTESEAKVARVRGYAAQRAIATHAKARPERERQWLDVLHMLDQPALADQPEQAS